MYKLNLHAHSTNSDGGFSVTEMAKAYMEEGFCCAVITDHVSQSALMSLTVDSYNEALEEAAAFTKEFDFPVIIGGEFGCARLEEVLVFGEDAIRYLLHQRELRATPALMGRIEIADLYHVQREYSCATVLAHPHLPDYSEQTFITLGGAGALDGYELWNHGQLQFKRREIPVEFADKIAVCNSDAHDNTSLWWNYNLVEESISSEAHLIKYIKEKKSFKHFVDFKRLKKKFAHLDPKITAMFV